MTTEDTGQQPDPATEADNDEILGLKNNLQEALDGWKRSAADFENYKRRKESEGRELIDFAREAAVAKLLPTLDALEQALRHLPEYSEAAHPPAEQSDFSKKYLNWQAGIRGIMLQLDQALGELGVRRIESVGKKFDPHLHEAVREVEAESGEGGMVVEELQPGFELNGKVLRPSQVVISKQRG